MYRTWLANRHHSNHWIVGIIATFASSGQVRDICKPTGVALGPGRRVARQILMLQTYSEPVAISIGQDRAFTLGYTYLERSAVMDLGMGHASSIGQHRALASETRIWCCNGHLADGSTWISEPKGALAQGGIMAGGCRTWRSLSDNWWQSPVPVHHEVPIVHARFVQRWRVMNDGHLEGVVTRAGELVERGSLPDY
eukprot:scaffold16728_cov31-Tisochrysis_lutea.AAC.2